MAKGCGFTLIGLGLIGVIVLVILGINNPHDLGMHMLFFVFGPVVLILIGIGIVTICVSYSKSHMKLKVHELKKVKERRLKTILVSVPFVEVYRLMGESFAKLNLIEKYFRLDIRLNGEEYV